MSLSTRSLFCDFCGRPEAHRVADLSICDDCYIAKGSCCAGEEADDQKERQSCDPTAATSTEP